MSFHRNAKLGLAGHYAVICAIEAGMTLKRTAACFREATAEPRATLACLFDRTSRPRRSPRQLAPELGRDL